MQPIPLPGQVATAAEKFQLQLAASFVHLNQNIPIIRHLFGKDVSLRGHFRFRLSIILWLLRSHTQGRIWGDPLGEAGGGGQIGSRARRSVQNLGTKSSDFAPFRSQKSLKVKLPLE